MFGYNMIVAFETPLPCVMQQRFSTPAVAMNQNRQEQRLLHKIVTDPEKAWPDFLEFFAPTLIGLVRLYVKSYDRQMDLFVHVAERLRAKEMKRVRSFRYRPEAPCTLKTYLCVVSRNLITDFHRMREGRRRPFSNVAGLEQEDHWIFEYHIRENRSLSETQQLLANLHGMTLDLDSISARADALARLLTPNQKWRLLSRLLARLQPLPVDPTGDGATADGRVIPIRSAGKDPESMLGAKAALVAFREALADVEPRKRLALFLRFGDGLKVRQVASTIGASEKQVEHWLREGISAVRTQLTRQGFTEEDLGPHSVDDATSSGMTGHG